jgi:uncharacterized membrane protein
MTSVADQPTVPDAARAPRWLASLADRPVAVFLLLSIVFGLPAVFVTPPLRGADEPAHFLRAYGISRGEIVPALADDKGRKGIVLPARINEGYQFFEAVRYRFGTEGFTYHDAFAEYRNKKAARTDPAPEFVLYAGSEGYAPVAYLPYVAAAWVARALNLDFVPMLWLMRLVGFVTATALAAYAIAIVPYLRWAFLLVATLPISLFERAIVCADGAALALTMLVTALCLRAAAGGAEQPGWRSLWMTLCVLIKPSHTAFVVLEGMTAPLAGLRRRIPVTALVVAPGLVFTAIWLIAGSSDMAAWRMIEGTGAPPEQFNIGWKLKYLLGHPRHFVDVSLGSLANTYELWREMIGGLGWRDTHLPIWFYLGLSAAFLATCLVHTDLDRSVRMRVAAVGGLTILGYSFAIFLIFYLAWTPIDSPFIHGIQGRYFTIILPIAAVTIAAVFNRALRQPTTAGIAIIAAIAAGLATIEAVIRTHW